MPSERSTLRRLPARGTDDPAVVRAVLDRGFVCHVGIADGGQPVVIPTVYARRDDHLLLHGSTASRLMRRLSAGDEACVTVTLVDGLVLARSTFHHSLNYRSVVAFGRATALTGEGEKRAALHALVERLVPGRGAEARGPSPDELKATAVVLFPLDDVTVKRREGPPADDPEDLDRATWAGVVPITSQAGVPQASPDLAAEIPVDASVAAWAGRVLG